MNFKKIEMVGFKSFADKTVFDFSSGLTAILGPNGCGKSNVVDAVKWVLGEQKAKSLRGGEMLDVIFSGSERRKPMGMAEVSLFFDNEDGTLPVEFNEVCITRRLYRSGESEYLINKQRCRLKDIKDLFMDTGIGTSAYSFIEQGKVEALLAAKPNERRIVFEEAAGISKYKARRKETIARLDRTEQYLLRVNDIVDEIEKRIRSVSRQAQSAKRFQRLNEELKETRGKLYVMRWEDENEKITSITHQLSELNELKVNEEMRSGAVGNQLTELQKQEMDIEQQLSIHEKEFKELQQEVFKSESEKARAEERSIALGRESVSLTEQAEALQGRIQNLDVEKSELEASKQELGKLTEELSQNVETDQTKYKAIVENIAELESSLESTRSELTDIKNKKSEILSGKARIDSEANTLVARRDTIQARLDSLREKKTFLETSKEELKLKCDDAIKKENEINEALNRNKLAVEDLRKKGEEIASAISSLENNKSGRESRLSTLKELENSMAGFFRGVKGAIEGWKNGKSECSDIEGVVADLFTVNSDCALAIETALGSGQQSIITNTAYGAKQAIGYLKRERKGRATFLPLDKIKGRHSVDGHLKTKDGVLGEAIDLVSFDSKYQAVAEYLLNGILIVESLDMAMQLRNNDRSAMNVRMVTLDGDVINPAGAMTGGRENSQKGGLITRKSEMDELSDFLTELETKLVSSKSNRDGVLAELVKTSSTIKQLEGELSDINRLSREYQNSLASKTAEFSGIADEVLGIESELNDISRRLEAIKGNAEELTVDIEQINCKEAELADKNDLVAPRLNDLKQQADDTSTALTNLKVTYAEKVQKLQDVNSRLESLGRDSHSREEEARRCEEKALIAKTEKVKIDEEIVALQDTVGEWLSKRNQSEAKYNELRQTLGDFKAKLEENRSEERAINRRISEITESINKLNIEERECALRIEAVIEKVREELDISDIETLKTMLEENNEEYIEEYVNDSEEGESEHGEQEEQQKLVDPIITSRELEHKVNELQEKIRKIGPVNHQAIEELAELKARAEFLGSERDDLSSARSDLDQLIERLNNECRKKFDDTFVKVRENFQLLFKRMFGGGKADLILEDNEDPLDAGIEIIARPPGKEPKSLSLLSGGEKALCAVALLFAIFRSKPSPFCILDEVDGPLDESNIDRYMAAVREFSEESQFIIITHSKRTMSMTDTIYGITQSEPGISEKISLKFDKQEEKQTPIAEGVA